MNTTIAADRNNFKVTFPVAFCEVRYLADGVLPIFMSFAAISSGFMLLFQGLVTCWNFTQVNMSITPNITRVTIFSAFIASPGPTVQIISDIRKSFS